MRCPVCDDAGSRVADIPGTRTVAVDCPLCGRYNLLGVAAVAGPWRISGDLRRLMTAHLRRECERLGGPREAPYGQEELTDIHRLEVSRDPPLGRKLDETLLLVARRTSKLGQYPALQGGDYSLVWAHDQDEFVHFLMHFKTIGYLDVQDPRREASRNPREVLVHARLTVPGWQEAEKLRSRVPATTQVFVAMWFDPSLDDAWAAGFFQGIADADYTPLRIDSKESVGKIDDEILMEIRRSHLVVADFTGQRQSVYFEAGFAAGLGIPVIWTCRAEDIDNLHFDIRQYNHIVWKDPADLRQRLTRRLKALYPVT